jgi:hypothetical protein
MQETQIRSLHGALRASALTVEQVDRILGRLAEIAVERRNATSAPSNAGLSRALPRRAGIDGPTVARLVARAKRSAAESPRLSAPRWLLPLRDQLANASRSIQRAQDRVAVLMMLTPTRCWRR